ncbi:hypothetical protein PENTCL1PPCAC_20781, partial [Pristionchus entomophagus]
GAFPGNTLAALGYVPVYRMQIPLHHARRHRRTHPVPCEHVWHVEGSEGIGEDRSHWCSVRGKEDGLQCARPGIKSEGGEIPRLHEECPRGCD